MADQRRPDDNLDYRENVESIYDVYERTSLDLPPGENPPSRQAGETGTVQQDSDTDAAKFTAKDNAAYLIQRAQEIYTQSSDYLDANITNQWERNLSHFNNEHAPGSVFSNTKRNIKRSRIFRPKTRAMVKKSERGLAVAAFSTQDLLIVKAQDPRQPQQVISAQINQHTLQYRLNNTIPWFQTTIGQYQDTKVYGVCISHIHWSYLEDTDVIPAFDGDGKMMMTLDDEGNQVPGGYEQTIVREDKPCVDDIAPENFRFDPMCDWRDPVGTSPFLIYIMPIYLGEAEERMEMKVKKTNQPLWKYHSRGALLGTRRQDYQRTRQAREGRERIDPATEQHGNSFTILWAHMNLIRVNGTDMVYWTMGTELLLTDPVPCTELYPHLREGERPFVLGYSTLEAHRNYPAGDVEQSSGLQEEINNIANQRMDNVKLVLNKRYHVRRGSQTDLDALVRNTPGGGVMMNDPERDVKVIDTPDITASAYTEQELLSVEMDELVGNFSQGSVQSNKNLNETVGGMGQMSQDANSMGDYSIQIFMITWMEPVLNQLLRLEQYYETDEVILSLAASQSDLWTRYGMDQVTDELLRQNLTATVDVGMGNTDPVRRVDRLIYGVTQALQLPEQANRMKGNHVTDEIFGALGYKDGSRFFRDDEEQAKYEEEHPASPPPEIMIKQKEIEMRTEENHMRDTRETGRLELERELGYAKLALENDMRLEDLYTKLNIAQMQDAASRESSERTDKTTREGKALDGRIKNREMNLKAVETPAAATAA